MSPLLGWGLAGAALVAGALGYGWRGIVLAMTVIAFWLLLQLSRTLRTMRLAARAPVGSVASAVMLHAELKQGMTLLAVLPLTRSLGRAVGAPEAETYRWIDSGGSSVLAVFRNGRLLHWTLERPAEPAEAP
jgi:hypothetical protein